MIDYKTKYADMTENAVRFTDNGNGTVTDHKTGLVWLRDASALGRLTWKEAMDACAALESGQHGLTDGSKVSDWRLPERLELESLLDLRFCDPALSNAAGTAKWSDGDAFSGVQSNNYWSSTSSVYGTSIAWAVYLSYGTVSAHVKANTLYVWPVRSSL